MWAFHGHSIWPTNIRNFQIAPFGYSVVKDGFLIWDLKTQSAYRIIVSGDQTVVKPEPKLRAQNP